MTTSFCLFAISPCAWNLGHRYSQGTKLHFWGTERSQGTKSGKEGVGGQQLCCCRQEMWHFLPGSEKLHCFFGETERVFQEAGLRKSLAYFNKIWPNWGFGSITLVYESPQSCNSNLCRHTSLLRSRQMVKLSLWQGMSNGQKQTIKRKFH